MVDARNYRRGGGGELAASLVHRKGGTRDPGIPRTSLPTTARSDRPLAAHM
jgi:hypothetical protein